MSELFEEIIVKKLEGEATEGFDCGIPVLNNFLVTMASQAAKRNVSVCYIMKINETIVGYYTLSSNSVDLSDFPSTFTKKLPKYPKVPVTLLGRLAIDLQFHGKNYGARLLKDALAKSLIASESVASAAVVVDAKNSKAEEFYSKFGFIPFSETRKLYLPMATIRQASLAALAKPTAKSLR